MSNPSVKDLRRLNKLKEEKDYRLLDRDDPFNYTAHKYRCIIVADDWHELTETEKREQIRAIIYQGNTEQHATDVMQLLERVRETEAYKYAQDQGVIDECHVVGRESGSSSEQSPDEVHEADLRSRAMSLLCAAQQWIREPVALWRGV